MRTVLLTVCVVFMVVSIAGAESWKQIEPQYKETKQLMKLVNDAVALVEKKGEAAFEQFGKKDSKWLTDDTYIFVDDMTGVEIVNPAFPELVGKNLIDLEDATGKKMVYLYINKASCSNHNYRGWVHYMWYKQGGILPTWKSTFVRRAKAPSGKFYVVGSGLYDMKMEKMFVYEKVTEAVELIEKIGRQAFSILRDKSGKFICKDIYIFVDDMNGKEMVNPAFSWIEGKDIIDLQDSNGKYIVREMLDIIKKNGSGWIEYMWPRLGASNPSKKLTFVMKAQHGEESFLVGAGVYSD
ncbi:MAG: hypothetical protein SRB1_01683 [Desulfobacteraceae bacterium Eth-SRB1]|nr:MAG: hypothetical protein SRB1_01683 [Desulfobacteraceae bacterium Eth-SRB1]